MCIQSSWFPPSTPTFFCLLFGSLSGEVELLAWFLDRGGCLGAHTENVWVHIRILRVTRPVWDTPEHSICLEGFCCHLPLVLLLPSSHSCCRKKKWLLGYVWLWPHGRQPARLLCPWDSPVKTTGVACHDLFQGIFLTQGLNPGLLHCREILYHLCHQGSTKRHLYTGLPFPSGEGNGTPLQYSCLENPMDGRAW